MKVLLVLTGLPDKKSPARSVYNLIFAEELINQGIEIAIINIRSLNPKYPILVKKKINQITYYEVRSTIPKLRFTKSAYFVSNLFRFILSNKGLSDELKGVNVIHAICGESIEAAFLVSKKFKTPLISQFIGSDLNTYFDSLLKRRNFVKGIKESKVLCFNSKGLRNLFLSKFEQTSNIKVLYRGVNLNEYSYNFSKNLGIRILFLGGFPNNGNLKGGLTLIEAIRLLNEKVFSKKITITIGGPNSLDFENLSQEIINTNLELEFIGALQKSMVKEYMKNSHIVLIPSLSEGLPNVLYEAMATGNLVIASDVGGISEVLISGKTGKLISSNSSELLMETIISCLDLDEIEKYALEGRRSIETLSYSAFIEEYIQIYSSFLKDSEVI